MNSDLASNFIHGNYIAEQNHWIFADNWYYATELPNFLYCDIIYAFLFRFIKDWRVVWTVGCIILYLILTVVVVCLTRKFGFTSVQGDICVLLFLLSTTLFADYTITYPYYTLLPVGAALFLALYLDVRFNDNLLWYNKKFLLFYILCFCLGTCGIRMFLMTIIPLAACEFYIWWGKHKCDLLSSFSETEKTVRSFVYQFRLIGFCFLSMLLGLVFLKKELEVRYGTGAEVLLTYRPNAVLDKAITLLPIRLLQLFGAETEISILSKRGILFAFQCVIAFCAIISVWKYVLSIMKEDTVDDRKRVGNLFFCFSGLITLIVLSLTGMGETAITERYLILGFWGLPFVIVSMINNFTQYSLKKVLTYIAVLVMFFISNIWLFLGIRDGMSYADPGYVKFLKESNYTYGAATFWNANVTTVRTDGKIEMKSVWNNENLTFYAWLQKKEHEITTPEFILLSRNEYGTRDENGFSQNDEIVYEDGDYVIFELSR